MFLRRLLEKIIKQELRWENLMAGTLLVNGSYKSGLLISVKKKWNSNLVGVHEKTDDTKTCHGSVLSWIF